MAHIGISVLIRERKRFLASQGNPGILKKWGYGIIKQIVIFSMFVTEVAIFISVALNYSGPLAFVAVMMVLLGLVWVCAGIPLGLMDHRDRKMIHEYNGEITAAAIFGGFVLIGFGLIGFNIIPLLNLAP